jgi:hydroxybutyrate-dimer hydrolase
MNYFNRSFVGASALLAILISGCGKNPEPPILNVLPGFIRGTVATTTYDGTTNDLLTAGLGRTGLASATAPAIADPANPTAIELRRLAIYSNYRVTVDTSTGGGFGTLFGPNVDNAGVAGTGEGRIAGEEWLAFSDSSNVGAENITMLVQIPTSFDVNNACIVAAPSPGSSGVYGAIGGAGEWGLKRGCAVAYTDKGTGVGFHDLQSDTVIGISGGRLAGASAGLNALFSANLAGLVQADMAAFNTATPNRLALKHAHSQRNSERDWGAYVLQSINFALYTLNQKYGADAPNGRKAVRYTPANTLVIAASIGNGAGAVLAAAELDFGNLIDAVAVASPQVQPVANTNLKIQRGGADVASFGKTQMDYVALANLYQPCAATAATLTSAPGVALLPTSRAIARCQALLNSTTFNIGITGATNEALAQAALAKLRAAGWEAETDVLHASSYALVTPSVAVTSVNTYGGKSVRDNECGFSFASTSATTFTPVPTTSATLLQLFGVSSGRAPTSTINIVNNNSNGGAVLDAISVDADGRQTLNADGAKCIASRVINFGQATAPSLTDTVLAGVRRSGNLRGKPAIIVHGRADAVTPANHTARAYFGLNKIVETTATSKLSYIEVTNAQHVDAFNGTVAGYDTRYVPIQRYFNQAMDAVFANVRSTTPLPASQVVRTTPRGGVAGAVPAITAANVPAFVATPAPANAITFANNTVSVPE